MRAILPLQPLRPWLGDVPGDPGWESFRARLEEVLAWPDENLLWLQTRDGKRLVIRSCLPAGPPLATVLLLHALTLHSKFYLRFGLELAQAGMAAFLLDLRGHGLSEGRRGDCPRRRLLVEDLRLFHLTIQGMYPDRPLVWVGHSLGALLWWKMLSETDLQPTALVSIGAGPLSAALRNLWRTGRLILWPRWSRLLTDGPGAGARFLHVLIPPVPAEYGFVLDYAPRFFWEALPWRMDLARSLPPVPILAVIGERDQGYDPATVKRYMECLGGDVSVLVHPQADHLNIIRNSSGSIIRWLQERVAVPSGYNEPATNGQE